MAQLINIKLQLEPINAAPGQETGHRLCVGKPPHTFFYQPTIVILRPVPCSSTEKARSVYVRVFFVMDEPDAERGAVLRVAIHGEMADSIGQ